ncbi:uncharacterized protein LOC123683993 [Harmonia axyridis]|uniref:uncharacterized protein LOC123683993 n=1 Tax=Harmonia axyridis TaxID=115357 RepID=UPI001E275065|nr:uncharacterized protein LOC123683993 [Harmonia axyridis]XP_045478993.1 uncharacterized protein LOC123683993 [Harmonia axyridis]
MWIPTVHIVIVYFCACAIAAEFRTKLGQNHRKSIVKRSVDPHSNYHKYNKNNYNSFNNQYDNYNSLSTVKLRHQSRFPNLDKVMTRVSNMKFGSGSEIKSEVHNKLRHRSWYEKKTTTTPQPEETFDHYFDDYGSDKENNDWGYDDVEYEDYEDDGVFEEPDWQAEEPTEKTTTTTPAYRQMSRISEMKWQMYGTRKKVEENRKKELFGSNSGSETSATLARVHFMRVSSEGTCKRPLPRVISVQNVHPDPSKTYTPHCTVLHRCAEDTGCCQQHNMRCGPKTVKEVHLYFYAKTLGTLESRIEKLTFKNHTECTCIEKPKHSEEKNGIQYKSGLESKNTTPQNLERCVCPGSFSPKQKYHQSECTCNCEETNPDCITMKNGLEYFSLADRKCVLERRCGIPICEFGAYIRPKGRCPRKQEKLDTFTLVNIQ